MSVESPRVECKRPGTSNSNRIELVQSFEILEWCEIICWGIALNIREKLIEYIFSEQVNYTWMIIFQTPRDQFFIEKSQPAVFYSLRYETTFLEKKQRKENESLWNANIEKVRKLPLKTEIDAKESTFHLSGWKFFPRPSPCSILICEQKKQWIRHRIDKLVLHSGIRKYCLLRRCFQPTSVIKWGIARGFHMKDKSILNLLTCSGYFPRHHPTIFTWRSSPPHHERAV